MNRRTRGFTLIEVLITILIGAILTSIAVKGFGLTSSEMSVRQARNVFQGLVARVRAQAIESGTWTWLYVDSPGDSVSIWSSGWDETVHFGGDMGIDIQGSVNQIWLCMTPRGYAKPEWNSFNSTVTIHFVQGDQTESVDLLPLGQVREP